MDDLAGYVSDDELAIEPLQELGWKVKTISWRDETVDWNDFTAVVIRTTWDYQKSPDDFLRVLRQIEDSKARLENSLKTVEWNLSKLYLRELEDNGVKIVPTIWESETPTEINFSRWLEHFGTDEIIIKPLVGANAEFTYRLRAFSPELAEIFKSRQYMVQPFMPKIVSEGEFSLFYFGGFFSHTILKTPRQRDFRVQEEHGGIITSVTPPAKLLETAQFVLSLIKPTPLYVRLDFVRAQADDFCLMELELIEPALYLRMNKNAPRFLAETIDKWLN